MLFEIEQVKINKSIIVPVCTCVMLKGEELTGGSKNTTYNTEVPSS